MLNASSHCNFSVKRGEFSDARSRFGGTIHALMHGKNHCNFSAKGGDLVLDIRSLGPQVKSPSRKVVQPSDLFLKVDTLFFQP